MKGFRFSYRDTSFFSDFICDYIEGENNLKEFYGRNPNLKSFLDQIKDKGIEYPENSRKILFKILKQQYKRINNLSKDVKNNIEAIASPKTFVITTAHQLNILTGPMYFIYKIISAINLCKVLAKTYPQYNFVPIYWMATEDHDFDEISNFSFKGINFKWERENAGSVGDFSLVGLKEVFDLYFNNLGQSPNSKKIKELVEKSYLSSNNLSNATRAIVNEIFGDYGLVVLDPNEKKLKELFIPYLKNEINSCTCKISVDKTNDLIKKKYNHKYDPQVNPRDINLFFLLEQGRKRIIKNKDGFILDKTGLKYSKNEILNNIKKYPEKFSPNVLMRPLYQEVILPNICYIGGSTELSYWLELKLYFDSQKIIFPIILNRNSALLLNSKTAKKINKLNLGYNDFFLNKDSLIDKKIRQISDLDLDLSFLKESLENQFKYLQGLVLKTDKSFKGAVEAQLVKQKKGIDYLEKRLIKAQKKKLSDHVERLKLVYEDIFPNGELQERVVNFTFFYELYGEKFIQNLIDYFDPLSNEFDVIEFEE